MSKLFPIGDITGGSSLGTINSINYSLFEPNKGCTSSRIYSNLTTTFESQIKLVRKKAEPYLTITYSYDNIFSREFRQIENFIDSIDAGLQTCYCIDWSKGITPTNVSSGWVVSIPETALYSIYAGVGANKGLLWDGTDWKLGTVSSKSTNTSITLSVNEGSLTYQVASSNGILYPVYQVYVTDASINSFKATEFIPIEAINLSNDGGFMYSGEVTFIGKYKV